MDAEEKKELVRKILNVDSDPKSARVAITVFINKADKETGKIFMDYLDHHDAAVKKAARHILGQLGIPEAMEAMVKEFLEIVGNLTFMPDEEIKESQYYSNLIDILEAVFAIIKSENLKHEALFAKIDEIFKRTKNEDLRFTLIKLLGILGDRLPYFLEIYDDLSEKERRALYYLYSVVEDPRRAEVYKKGLHDDRNFDYVILNLLNFDDGKKLLRTELLNMGSYNKQTVLKKLMDGMYPEFNDALIKMLNDKNKFLVELSIENLKRTITKDTSLQPFIDLVESGYSPEGIQGALEIIAHFVKNNPEDIYLEGLEKQPAHKNKTIILDFFIDQLKKKHIHSTEEVSEKILPRLLVYFDNYTKEKEELFLSVFKIITQLKYPNAGKVKSIKAKLLHFKKEFDPRLSTQFRNNFSEFLVKFNSIIARHDEAEAKIKQIVVLFDIDAHKIEHSRMLKLKEQLADLMDILDNSTIERLLEFLGRLAADGKIEWKIKAVALELLGEYGTLKQIPIINTAMETESSLAVKTNAQKALKKIEERNADLIESVLVMVPLFYLQKILNEFFKSRAYRVFNLAQTSMFEEVSNKDFSYVVISENLFTPELSQELFDYVDEHMDSVLIVITAQPEKWESYKDIPNIRFLKKPFKPETIAEVIDAKPS